MQHLLKIESRVFSSLLTAELKALLILAMLLKNYSLEFFSVLILFLAPFDLELLLELNSIFSSVKINFQFEIVATK